MKQGCFLSESFAIDITSKRARVFCCVLNKREEQKQKNIHIYIYISKSSNRPRSREFTRFLLVPTKPVS